MPNPSSDRRPARRPAAHARPGAAGRRRQPSRRRTAALVAGAVAAFLLVASLAGGALGPGNAPVALASPLPSAPGPSEPAESAAGPSAPAASASPRATASPSPTPRPTTPGGLDAGLAARLQARLESLTAKLQVPGVSVAILWDDGRSWTGAAGLADIASQRPVTPGTGFALASISKTFTAAVVLQLVGEGRLGLDEPVAPLLPSFKLDLRITVRMLLDHTSGLPDYFLNATIDRALRSAPDATWTVARTWTYVGTKRPVPGTVWTYSNSNYLLLGELVHAVTGRSLADEVRSRLLDPLRLTDTWYQVAEAPLRPLITGYRLVPVSGGVLRPVRIAPVKGVTPYRAVVTAAGGAGSVAGTALDTARWMRAFAGGQVLDPELQRAMLADASVTAALRARVPYGLGIQVTELSGRPALGHSGRFLGVRNVVRYLPDEGITIAVLTNQSAVDPARIASSMLRPLLPPLPDASPSASPSEAPASPAASAAP